MEDITSHNIDRFISCIQKAERIVIVGHMKPDGDALGSCLGMYHYLRLHGKEDRKVVFPDPLEPKIRYSFPFSNVKFTFSYNASSI